MRIGTGISYAGGFADSVADVVELEKAGLDVVFVPEAYSFDAVSQLGYLAAKTERVQLASGIFQIYTRTPTLTAMTAAGLDFVSDGRFILGLGASGPQVIEGFHGVKYDAPLARTREIVEVCRQVWRRERVVHEGKHYTIPLPPEQGTGLGKPLKLINHPVRERIPVLLASLGPKNVALTAEIAEGWQPIFFHPEKAADVWGASLAEGKAKRDAALGELDTFVSVALAIGDDVESLLDHVRPVVALYVGGMGARGKNFYNDLACRYGYEAEAKLIQDLYLDGKKEEAAAAVPLDLLRAISLVGPAGYVKERLAAFAAAGATTLVVNPLQPGREARVAAVSQLRELID
ncbi:LLM class F420-dependent oxidoreductase [Amycolatopsis sp. NPDC051102]|uniref:LLM class F420-dependent oxidoreductase n=1 Tax=Amycolatopsis sp. NPDC051102 TaxID=3155163 RepID=UPI0034126428